MDPGRPAMKSGLRVRGVSCAEIERSCVRGSTEKAPSLLADMRTVCDKGALGLARLRSAVERGSLPHEGSGLGPPRDDAAPLGEAAPLAVAFFGVRWAPEVAQLVGGDTRRDAGADVAHLRVKRQKNDQYGVGPMAHRWTLGPWRAR